MPYNNTPIDPPKNTQFSGQANLPLARTKKIIGADEDIGACSNNAAFAITVAAECFIRYLSEQTYNVSKSERKRRLVTYDNLATAVHKYDNLEFLVDVVPKTITYKQWKEKQDRLVKKEQERERLGATSGSSKAVNGQQTLHQMTNQNRIQTKPIGLDGADDDVEMRDAQHDPNGDSKHDKGVVTEDEESPRPEPKKSANRDTRHNNKASKKETRYQARVESDSST